MVLVGTVLKFNFRLLRFSAISAMRKQKKELEDDFLIISKRLDLIKNEKNK